MTVSIKVNGTWTELPALQGSQGETGATGQTGATGKGITSITKTATNGLVDTYTITYSDSTTSTFEVTNGSNGTNGTNGSDYVLTNNDKSDIADLVYAMFTAAEGVSV